LLFLKDGQTATWLKNPDTALDDSLLPASKMATIAQTASADKRFFHWELEFPEIFFAPSSAGANDVHLLEDGGFDVVVGNPPYGVDVGVNKFSFVNGKYSSVLTNDSVEFFFHLYPSILSKDSSQWGIIIPKTILYYHDWKNIRFLALNKHSLTHVVDVGVAFEGVNYEEIIMIVSSNSPNKDSTVIVQRAEPVKKYKDVKDFTHLGDVSINFMANSGFISVTHITKSLENIFNRVYENSVPLANLSSAIYRGLYVPDAEKSNLKEGDDLFVESVPSVWRYEIDMNQIWHVNLSDEKWADKIEKVKVERLILKVIRGDRLHTIYDYGEYITTEKLVNVTLKKEIPYLHQFLCAVCNTPFVSFFLQKVVFSDTTETARVMDAPYSGIIPIPRIDFVTPADERQAQTESLKEAYLAVVGKDKPAEILNWRQEVYSSTPSDVIHDFLAYLAERMIALNQQKQAEVNRFLDWVMKTLRLRAGVSVDDLKGKTILQGYLGDYQKGQGETAWKEFSRRLYDNRGVFEKSLTDVEKEIEAEYEKSLTKVLLPIKKELEQTDMLIDKIVYRLYGLSDAEIELIERPAFQQSLTDAKSDVVKNDKLDDEEKVEALSEGILSLARRYFARIDPQQVAQELDKALPNWASLPPEAPKFLQTGEYILNTFPDDMDFSASIIPYTKAVEVVLAKRIFEPFRQQYTDGDCENKFLKDYLLGIKELTLVNFMIILSSSKERALRNFVQDTVKNLAGLLELVKDNKTIGDQRNDAAHDVLFGREDARAMRAWAIAVLRTL
jgi:hypothetical protein